MITIHKYPFAVSDKVTVVIPGYIGKLKIATQSPGSGQLCLWAIVETESDKVERINFRIVGTGHPFDDYDHTKHYFADSVIDGRFVWHIFQIADEEAPDAEAT